MEYLCIVNNYNNDCFIACSENEVEKAIDDAKHFYENDIKLFERNLISCPEMTEHWQKELETTHEILKAGFEVITPEEYRNRERKRWLSTEAEESTAEDFNYALNVLPPLNWIRNDRYSMFHVGECYTMSFYRQYLYDRETKKYYTALTDITDESTWLDKLLNL